MFETLKKLKYGARVLLSRGAGQPETVTVNGRPTVLMHAGEGTPFVYLHSTEPGQSDIQRALSDLSPPFVVFTNIVRADELHFVERTLAGRFASAAWRDSAAEQPWNLRYFYVPQDVTNRQPPSRDQ